MREDTMFIAFLTALFGAVIFGLYYQATHYDCVETIPGRYAMTSKGYVYIYPESECTLKPEFR